MCATQNPALPLESPPKVSEEKLKISDLKRHPSEVIVNDRGMTLPFTSQLIVPKYYKAEHGAEDSITTIGQLSGKFNPFPIAVRAINFSGQYLNFLIETPPTQRTILFNPDSKINSAKADANRIKLQFPWTQIVFSLRLIKVTTKYEYTAKVLASSVAFSDRPLSDHLRDDVSLYSCTLPNVMLDGATCFDTTVKGSSLGELFKTAVNSFYSSTFNLNLEDSERAAESFIESTFVKDFEEWKFKKASNSLYLPGDPKVWSKAFGAWAKLTREDMLDLERCGFRKISTSEKAFYSEGKSNFAPENWSPFQLSFDIDFAQGEVDNHLKMFSKRDLLVPTKDKKFGKLPAEKISNYFPTYNKLALINAGLASIRTSIPKSGETIERTAKISPTEEILSVDKVPSTVKHLGLPAFRIRLPKIEKALDAFMNIPTTGANPLPPGVRHWDPISGLIVFERPPGYKNITFYNNSKGAAKKVRHEKKKRFKIWTPWTQYWVRYSPTFRISSIHMTVSEKPITEKTTLAVPPYPNIYSESHVCLPPINSASNLAEVVTEAYTAVWGSNFNTDLVDTIYGCIQQLPAHTPTVKKQFDRVSAKAYEHIANSPADALTWLEFLADPSIDPELLMFASCRMMVPNRLHGELVASSGVFRAERTRRTTGQLTNGATMLSITEINGASWLMSTMRNELAMTGSINIVNVLLNYSQAWARKVLY